MPDDAAAANKRAVTTMLNNVKEDLCKPVHTVRHAPTEDQVTRGLCQICHTLGVADLPQACAGRPRRDDPDTAMVSGTAEAMHVPCTLHEKKETMHGTPLIMGDHLARSVRGRPCAPPPGR